MFDGAGFISLWRDIFGICICTHVEWFFKVVTQSVSRMHGFTQHILVHVYIKYQDTTTLKYICLLLIATSNQHSNFITILIWEPVNKRWIVWCSNHSLIHSSMKRIHLYTRWTLTLLFLIRTIRRRSGPQKEHMRGYVIDFLALSTCRTQTQKIRTILFDP